MKNKDKFFKVLLILDMIAVFCFFIAYGPIKWFRNTLVTSAMTTQNHQYLAYILYNDSMIEKTMADNMVISFASGTDANAIKFNNKEVTEYVNEYEEKVLKKDKDNDLYKVFKVEYNKNTGYILVVYDPSRIKLENSKYNAIGGQVMTDLVKSYEAIAGVNASGFARNGTTGAIKPGGTIIQDGKITSVSTNPSYGRGLIGFNKDNVLVLTYDEAKEAVKNGMRDALTFGPFLIVNGEKAFIKGDGGWGYAPRTAIAQRKDGIVLFAVFDGRNLSSGMGMSMVDMTDLLSLYGAYNAANLDGGGSSTLVVNNELINNPGGWGYSGERYLCNAWLLK